MKNLLRVSTKEKHREHRLSKSIAFTPTLYHATASLIRRIHSRAVLKAGARPRSLLRNPAHPASRAARSEVGLPQLALVALSGRSRVVVVFVAVGGWMVAGEFTVDGGRKDEPERESENVTDDGA